MGNEEKRGSRPRDAAAHERAETGERPAERGILERTYLFCNLFDRGILRLPHIGSLAASADRPLADRDAADAAPAEIAIDAFDDDRRGMLQLDGVGAFHAHGKRAEGIRIL